MVRWINSTDCIYRNGGDKKNRGVVFIKTGQTRNIETPYIARLTKQAT
ncbi:hypothetical protein ACY2C8_12120 [Mammaliicoccus sciuri]